MPRSVLGLSFALVASAAALVGLVAVAAKSKSQLRPVITGMPAAKRSSTSGHPKDLTR